MNRESEPIGLAKAILWEEAVGKLNAIVAISKQSKKNKAKCVALYNRIDRFILDIEQRGLHK